MLGWRTTPAQHATTPEDRANGVSSPSHEAVSLPITLMVARTRSGRPGRAFPRGLILLAGIVVKNSILLIDFITTAKERGESTHDALVGSVRIRTRPILMTAVGTSVGMIPIALEWAIGLERLSPLAIVAIGGLMVSTFLTMVYVPILYSLFEDAHGILRRLVARTAGAPSEV